MPFIDDEPVNTGRFGLPEAFDLHPEVTNPNVSTREVLGAAWRTENPIGSMSVRLNFDPRTPFDPDYRVYDEIEGTKYETFSDRFVGIRNRDQAAQLKAKLDQEIADGQTIHAAGAWGYVAAMASGLLSPTTLLPGGALVQAGRTSIRVGKTAISVGSYAALAAALDEAVLQTSQETRVGAETAAAIGGSLILGGMLGSAAGALSRPQMVRAAATAEDLPAQIHEFQDQLRSVGAAENAEDLTVRRERLFQFFNQAQFRVEDSLAQYVGDRAARAAASPLAVLRPLVRSDPILRAMLSDNVEARRGLAELVETPLQYAVNDAGRTASQAGAPVESIVKRRRNTELALSLRAINRGYAEYWNDGPVGMVGRMTSAVTSSFTDLFGVSQKFSRQEFMDQVGRAMRNGDQHPIPQVAQVAQELRKNIYDKALADATELGIFDPDLELNNAGSYFTRVYNQEKIRAHLNDGSDNDMVLALTREFEKNRKAAQTRLEQDDTLERTQQQVLKAREGITQARRALRTALKKARGKRDRAAGAVKREEKVIRVAGGLRDAFKRRADDLRGGVLQGPELAAFKDMLRDARNPSRLEPEDMVSAIRSLGGIQDDRARNRWMGGDWVSDGTPTDIEKMFGASANTIRRRNGLTPDRMREALAELGYLDADSTVSDLMNALERSSRGEKVYSKLDEYQLSEFQAAVAFRDDLEAQGIDLSKSVDQVIAQIPGMSRSQKGTRAKAKEADRSSKKAGTRASDAGLVKAVDRFEKAKARVAELTDEVQPKVRAEVQGYREDIKKLMKDVAKLQDQKTRDEFYAAASDAEVREFAQDAVRSIIGLKVGEHSMRATLSSPTRARVLDVADEVLAPWLEDDAGLITSQYFNSIVPDIEMVRRFGDTTGTEVQRKIIDEGMRQTQAASTPSARKRALEEAEERRKEFAGMVDRITGRYGVPEDPSSGWVRANRSIRTLSYMGYLGGMTLSALPDVAAVIGRNGLEAAFGSMQALTDPKRMGLAIKDAAELGAASELYLNQRSVIIADILDQYGQNSRFERGLSGAANKFGMATGMIPWNAAWKSVGSTFGASRMAKAAVDFNNGKATKKQIRTLAENGIDTVMAQRIAKQIDQYGDKDGLIWLPQGRLWDDDEAFEAFANAMNREMDLMIITPGQDKPLFFSGEIGKFFAQFKSFAFSAHHRILLSGMQRADAQVLAQVTTAVALGLMVSKIKAYQGGYEQKEGVALWEDAIDRSGLAGWLFEVHGMANGATGGSLSISGEEVSRFASRSQFQGLLGPSVDMMSGVFEGTAAAFRGEMSERDARGLLRPIPGSNIPYVLGLTNQIAEAMAAQF